VSTVVGAFGGKFENCARQWCACGPGGGVWGLVAAMVVCGVCGAVTLWRSDRSSVEQNRTEQNSGCGCCRWEEVLQHCCRRCRCVCCVLYSARYSYL